jgi:hypothetical protein
MKNDGVYFNLSQGNLRQSSPRLARSLLEENVKPSLASHDGGRRVEEPAWAPCGDG